MANSYKISDDNIIRTLQSGREQVVCAMGGTVAVCYDKPTGMVLAHGNPSHVARLINSTETFIEERSIGVFTFAATQEAVTALNLAINDHTNLSSLMELAQTDEPEQEYSTMSI